MLFIKKRNAVQKAIHNVAKVAENHEVATIVTAAVVTAAAGYGTYQATTNVVAFAKTKIANRDNNKITKLENQISDLNEKIAKTTDPDVAKKLNEKLTKLNEKLQELKASDNTDDTEDDATDDKNEDKNAPEAPKAPEIPKATEDKNEDKNAPEAPTDPENPTEENENK